MIDSSALTWVTQMNRFAKSQALTEVRVVILPVCTDTGLSFEFVMAIYQPNVTEVCASMPLE